MVRINTCKNPTRIDLIRNLRRKATTEKSQVWDKVASELDRVRKNRREVNLHKINKHTDKGDTVVVPGKVLGSGGLSHEVNIAAFRFSEGALVKIKAAGGKALEISELAEDNPKGTGVKIIG